MNKKLQRLAIADALGLEVMGDGTLSPIGILMVRKKALPRRKELTDWRSQDDWTSDLNAMHEAESMLGTSPDWSAKYIEILQFVGGFQGIRSTAAQRAEAFLRTLNLWTD